MSQSEDSDSPKRRAILNAATELFTGRGYGAVSMDAIAKAADVSKATLYAHFQSKDALFARIIQVASQANFVPGEALPTGLTTEADLKAALRTIGGRLLRFFLEDRVLAIHRLVIAESLRFPELGRAFYENGPLAGRAMLAAWMVHQPGLDVSEPEIAAEQFIGLLRTGLYLRATLGLAGTPTEAAIDDVVEVSVRTFLRAYRSVD